MKIVAEIALVIHKSVAVITRRLGVISSEYRKCMETARNLSRAIAVTDKNDDDANKTSRNQNTVIAIGHKKSKLWPSFCAVFNIKLVMITNIGCAHKPTARSDTARFRNRTFMLSVSDEDFQRAAMTSRFPTIVTREDTIFIKQRDAMRAGWKRTRLASSCSLYSQSWATMSSQFWLPVSRRATCMKLICPAR